MCVVTITLLLQSQVRERSCVLLPLHYLYKAWKKSGHVHRCTGSVMVKKHITAHLPGFVQVM
jgi:hypothetical protein